MGYSIYEIEGRDAGYGVPAECDHPECKNRIDRGLSYRCMGTRIDGGCDLFFCGRHLDINQHCERCATEQAPFKPKPDVAEWISWKLTHPSWRQWRQENQEDVKALRAQRLA